MKKGLLITAVVLVAVGLLIFGIVLVATNFNLAKLDSAKYETNTHTPEGDFESIEIQTDEADVSFYLSEDGEVRVVCFEPEKVKHEVLVENGTLKITSVDTRKWSDRVTFFSSKSPSVKVYLPKEAYASLSVTSSTGDVTVPDGFSFGDVSVTVSTGRVLMEASSSGSMKITASTGDIRLTGVFAKQMDLSVSTGRIHAQDIEVEGAFSVKTSTGKTVLTDVKCQTLFTKGSTGDLILKNTVASDSFTIERNTGDVYFENSDAPEISVKTSTGDVTGTLRTEKIFRTETSTGRIKVPDTVSGGVCRITTSTGDIKIEIAND